MNQHRSLQRTYFSSDPVLDVRQIQIPTKRFAQENRSCITRHRPISPLVHLWKEMWGSEIRGRGEGRGDRMRRARVRRQDTTCS